MPGTLMAMLSLAVLPGGKEVAKMQLWHARLAQFLGSLKDERGRAIPVIFRPWHEMSGAWFWWGNKQCTPEQYKALFCLTFNAMADAGLTNLVWSYSPNVKPTTHPNTTLVITLATLCGCAGRGCVSV